jgi:hypothetical protein
MDRAEVEAIASGRTTSTGRLDVRELGSARAELARRDQEYAEQQEEAHREFEREMERSRIEREKNRQEFDAALARENREAARETGKPQEKRSGSRPRQHGRRRNDKYGSAGWRPGLQ